MLTKGGEYVNNRLTKARKQVDSGLQVSLKI